MCRSVESRWKVRDFNGWRRGGEGVFEDLKRGYPGEDRPFEWVLQEQAILSERRSD